MSFLQRVSEASLTAATSPWILREAASVTGDWGEPTRKSRVSPNVVTVVIFPVHKAIPTRVIVCGCDAQFPHPCVPRVASKTQAAGSGQCGEKGRKSVKIAKV